MNLAELIDEVYTITNRPDLIAETLTAVRSATLKMHQADYFYKDLYETGLSFEDPTLYIQEIDLSTFDARWRALKYLRKFDANATPAPGAPGVLFKLITPELVFNEYDIQQENVCYVAGDILKIRSNTTLAHALIGYYRQPVITVSGFTSWIARDHPYAIVFQAASKLFKMIGKDAEATFYDNEAGQQLLEIRMSNIEAEGR